MDKEPVKIMTGKKEGEGMTAQGVAPRFALAVWSFVGWIACAAAATQEPAQTPPESGMTFWQLTVSGGPIMIVLGVMSVVALAMIITFLVTLNPRREVPDEFVVQARSLLQGGDVGGCELLCQQREEMLPRIILAGLKVAGHDRYAIIEAMEGEGARLAAERAQRVGYLSNIATLAPMLGILGTVLGMIMAFNSIAFQPGAVKMLVLARGVSMAVVTTAAGLFLAIPAMAFYFYFRARLQKIVATAEGATAEFVELLTHVGGGKR